MHTAGLGVLAASLFALCALSIPTDRVGTLPPGAGDARLTMATSKLGWLFSRAGLWRTNNGGVTWKSLVLPDSVGQAEVDRAALLNETKGFVVSRSHLWITENAGDRWLNRGAVPSDESEARAANLVFATADMSQGWAVGSTYERTSSQIAALNYALKSDSLGQAWVLRPMIWHTNDQGAAWDLQRAPHPLRDFTCNALFVHSPLVAVVSTETSVYHTKNAGVTWKRAGFVKTCDPCGFFSALAFSGNTGVLMSDEGLLFRSSDGGEHWTQIAATKLKNDLHVTHLILRSQSEIVGITWSGSLVRSGDGGLTWAGSRQTDVYSGISLSQDGQVWAIGKGELCRVR